jgi:hypothetical protein
LSDEDADERAERLDRKAAAERRDWRESKNEEAIKKAGARSIDSELSNLLSRMLDDLQRQGERIDAVIASVDRLGDVLQRAIDRLDEQERN